MSERRYQWRVRSINVIHYHGRSYESASWAFDQAQGSRVLERYAQGEWSDVISISQGEG